MSMQWEDERYVRIYTRDTADWLSLSFLAQGLFCLLLRKVDRFGQLPLGRHGSRAVAIAIGFPGEWTRLEPALGELLEDGCVSIEGDLLTIKNFVAAQEAKTSGAQRTREWRERHRDAARKKASGCDETSHGDETSPGSNVGVTPSDGMSPKSDGASLDVTNGDDVRRGVTRRDPVPYRTVPSLAVPSRTEPSDDSTLVVERVRLAVSDRLGIVGPGGKRLSLGAGRNLGQTIRAVNEAVQRCGLDAVVAACVAYGREQREAGNAPETLGMFRGVLSGLQPDGKTKGALREVVGLDADGEPIYAGTTP